MNGNQISNKTSFKAIKGNSLMVNSRTSSTAIIKADLKSSSINADIQNRDKS